MFGGGVGGGCPHCVLGSLRGGAELGTVTPNPRSSGSGIEWMEHFGLPFLLMMDVRLEVA